MGVFDDIVGLIFGRPAYYAPEDVDALWKVVANYATGMPVLANVDCGHTDPMLTLPLGAAVRLNAGARSFSTLEPPTSRTS